MVAPLYTDLLFCFFSLLFGGFSAVFKECMHAIFLAFRLLSDEKKTKRVPFHVKVGYFFYDFSLFTALASLYMVFLYFVNEGAFRFYSVLLCILGFFLFDPVARLFARPIEYIFSRIALLFVLPMRHLCHFFRRLTRKNCKRLDEKNEMV